MLIQPTTNQFITNKIQYNRVKQSKKDKYSIEQAESALPSFADAKSLINISFKARIHDFAKGGYLKGVQEELVKGFDVNLKDENGDTALTLASHRGYTEIVKELLKHPDIDVNVQEESKFTALMLASQGGYTETVKELLKHPDIDVNITDTKYGNTALIWASQGGYTETVAELLKHPDVDVNRRNKDRKTALIAASLGYRTEIVKDLLKHPDIDVNAICNADDLSALIAASRYGHTEIVKELLKHPDININYRTQHGETALTAAAHRKGSIDIVAELLKHPDVDVNLEDSYGRTGTYNANYKIREMIQNYVPGVGKREEVLPPKVDISKLTSFDEIWSDEEKQKLEKLIEEKDFAALAKFFESKGVELNEKYKHLITSIDEIKEQTKEETRISETEKIREEEKAKAQQSVQDKIAELEEDKQAEEILWDAKKQALDEEKAKYEEQNEALNNVMQNYKAMLADDVAYERQTLESGFRTLYGVKPQEIPENATLGEQMVYVMDVLLSRRNKLSGTDSDTPEKITKALQDKNGKISQDGLKFLERVIDTNDGRCQEKDVIDAIESAKDDHGLLNMGAVTFFISSLAWVGNSIRSVIEKVGKYGVNAKKIIR